YTPNTTPYSAFNLDPNSFSTWGPVSDYAANAMVIGSGMNTTSPGHYDGWSNPTTMPCFHRKITDITDGTSNTILVGEKALATNVYGNRGSGDFTMSSNPGATRGKYDDPITMADIWQDTGYGICRAQDQDTVFWIAGSDPAVIPGTRFGL